MGQCRDAWQSIEAESGLCAGKEIGHQLGGDLGRGEKGQWADPWQ